MEAKITTAADYKKRFGQKFKIITTALGETFKIQKLVIADFLQQTLIPLGFVDPEDMESWKDKTKEERAEAIEKNSTPERDKAFRYNILVKGVAEPKLTLAEIADENELSVYDLNEIDAANLFTQILEISGLSREGREDIAPFPAGERSDAGLDGQSVQPDAARTNSPGN